MSLAKASRATEGARASHIRFTDPLIFRDISTREIFHSIREDAINLYHKLASGAGDERLLLKPSDGYKYPTSSSRDGRFLLYTVEIQRQKVTYGCSP
jgi:hypothetical protein